MKCLTGFLLFLLFTSLSLKFYSQDTIVSDNGSIFSGLVTTSDSLFLSYKKIDSSQEEISLIKRSSIILIKYGDGRIEQFYKNDTLLTKDGEEIKAKILEIDSDLITYFQFDGTINEAKIVPLSSLFMYKLASGEKVVVTEKKNDDLIDYRTLGESDAKIYYKTNKLVIAGQFLLGSFFWTGLPGIAGIILPLIPPKDLYSPLNPNDKLLETNSDYKSGYKKVASNKKIKSYYASFGAGVLLPIGLIIYGSYYW